MCASLYCALLSTPPPSSTPNWQRTYRHCAIYRRNRLIDVQSFAGRYCVGLLHNRESRAGALRIACVYSAARRGTGGLACSGRLCLCARLRMLHRIARYCRLRRLRTRLICGTHIALARFPSQPSDRCAKFYWPVLRWLAAQPRVACGRIANCMCLQRCSPRHRGGGLLRPALLICAFAHASPYCAVSSTPPPSYTPNMRHTYRPRAILPSQPTDRCAKYRPVPLHVRHTSHKPTPQPAQPARS